MLQVYLSLLTRSASYLLSAALAIFALSYPALSTADNYLDSIEAEAESTTVLQKAQKEQEKLLQLSSKNPAKSSTAKTKPAKAKSTKKKETGTSTSASLAKQFEAGLYREFPGNYAVYTTLSENDKNDALAAYKEASGDKGLMRYGSALNLILKRASQ